MAPIQTLSLASTAVAGIVAFVIYVIGVVVYRLTLHPLAKYPGPLLGRITDWYSVIRAVAGDRHIHFLELHKKHGPFVRFGPNRVSVNTAEGLVKIYGNRANVTKSKYYSVFGDVFNGNSSHTTIDEERHALKKKVVSSSLSENSFRAMEDLILNNVRKFTQRLGEGESSDGWSSTKDVAEWAEYLSFDVMGDICFSGSFEMLDKEENRFVLRVLSEGVNGLNTVGWMPWIVRLKIGNLLFSKLHDDLKQYEAFAQNQSSRRLALGVDHPVADIYSYLIKGDRARKEKGLEPLFTSEDLVGEASLLITAGSDTTAAAISTSFFYLLRNPKALERLRKELRDTFSTVEDIRAGAALTSCRWLRACVEESMRMSPSVPGLMPREALNGGVEIAGHVFPAGADLGVPIYAIHHNEDLYPDSFSYRPERWLPEPWEDGETEGEARARVERAQAGYCAFSIGSRGCVGKSVAIKELMIAVARVLFTYDVRFAPGEEHVGAGGEGLGYGRNREGEYQIADMFVSKTKGPMLQFRKARAD